MLSMQELCLLKEFVWCSINQSLSLIGGTTKESGTKIQDVTLRKVSYRQTIDNPPSPAKEFVFKCLLLKTPHWHFAMSVTLT